MTDVPCLADFVRATLEPLRTPNSRAEVGAPNVLGSASDASIVDQLLNDPGRSALYHGGLDPYQGDHSRADLALATLLAQLCGNRAQVERIWVASPLGRRPKTQTRADYRQATVDKAFDRPVFQPINLDGATCNSQLIPHGVLEQKSQPWISAADLRLKHFNPTEWVVPGIVPQGAIILGGRPKLGKSWAALEIAIAVAEGSTAFGQVCSAGDVLYAALEDTQRRLKSRMAKLKEHTPWSESLSFICELPRADEGGVEIVRSWLVQAANARLVIVDTLAKVRPGKGRDEGSYDADYRAVTCWKDLADEFNIAVILVHHVRKLAADDPLEMISGTNGLTGAADAILILNRSSQGCTLGGRGRDLEEFDLAIRFDAPTCRWSVLGEAADVRRSDERNSILDLLQRGQRPMSPKEIAASLGANDDAVRQMLLRMTEAGEIAKAGRGLYAIPSHDSHNVRML